MSSVLENSSLDNHIWVAGMKIGRGPARVDLRPQRAEATTVTSNLGKRRDRVFIDDGYPNVPNKIDLSLTWPDVREDVILEHLTSLSNIGQPFDVAVFKQESDFFDGDGLNKVFYLQRRVVGPTFYSDNPETELFPNYQIRPTSFAAQFGTSGATPTTITNPAKLIYKTAATIDGPGSPAADEIWIEEDGHAKGDRLDTKIIIGTAPADGHDTFRVTYIPLMRMLISSDSGRAFETKLRMARSFVFTEQ